jgi:hypothetical protein
VLKGDIPKYKHDKRLDQITETVKLNQLRVLVYTLNTTEEAQEFIDLHNFSHTMLFLLRHCIYEEKPSQIKDILNEYRKDSFVKVSSLVKALQLKCQHKTHCKIDILSVLTILMLEEELQRTNHDQSPSRFELNYSST